MKIDDNKVLMSIDPNVDIDKDGSCVIPFGVTKIGKMVFKYTSVKTVIVPNTVTAIGEDAFLGCLKLSSINLPDSITEIGTFAFLDCKSLTSVNLPENIKEIKIGTFSGCQNLHDVQIPQGVILIGFSAFKDCAALTSITIPDTIENIQEGALMGCDNLKEIKINDHGLLNDRVFPDPDGQYTEIKPFKCDIGKLNEI